MENNISLPIFINQKEQAIVDSFLKEKKKLLGFIRKRVADKDDAEDILQDVFYQLIENFTPVEPIEKVSSWLFKVARNKIIDKYRKKKPVSFTEHEQSVGQGEYSLQIADILYDKTGTPEELHFNSLIWDTILEALDELHKEQSQVFIWHELEGKSFKEISATTGITVNTLLSRKRYAIMSLRKRLQKLYDEL